MQLQSIAIAIVFFICIYDHTRAIPIQQKEIFSGENENNTSILKSPIRSRKCTYHKDCPIHSWCYGSRCFCEEGWVMSKSKTKCHLAYKHKSKWTAFGLSFFLGGTGADWFYLARENKGYIVAGVLKLLSSSGCCCLFCYLVRPTIDVAAGQCVSTLASFGASIWWLIDWIRILCDAFPDGNGAKLR
jgi:hypothetical protein